MVDVFFRFGFLLFSTGLLRTHSCFFHHVFLFHEFYGWPWVIIISKSTWHWLELHFKKDPSIFSEFCKHCILKELVLFLTPVLQIKSCKRERKGSWVLWKIKTCMRAYAKLVTWPTPLKLCTKKVPNLLIQ